MAYDDRSIDRSFHVMSCHVMHCVCMHVMYKQRYILFHITYEVLQKSQDQ